jgi:YVTN family beta-propeller protein
MVISTIPVRSEPNAIVITPDGTEAYVANFNANAVSIIDTATNAVRSVTVAAGGDAIAITPDGAEAYVVSFEGVASVIDTAASTVRFLAVGDAAEYVGITPDQAPLAKFTEIAGANGLAITFDASSSVSPTGTITMYFWDFGDGNTLNTSDSSTTHVYAVAGMYTVSLTVTNSAGTSTDQIFSFCSGAGIATFSAYSMPMTNNGGPTATVSRVIMVNPSPPRNFRGYQAVNKFLNHTVIVNILTWEASLTEGVLSYRIYRNAQLTDLVAEIPAAQPLIFEDCNRKKNRAYTYYIVAISPDGISPAASTTVNPHKGDRCK